MKYARKSSARRVKRCMKGGKKKMHLGKAIQKTVRRIGKSGLAKKVGRKLSHKLLDEIDKIP